MEIQGNTNGHSTLKQSFEAQKKYFLTHRNRPLRYRIEKIKEVGKYISRNEAALCEALRSDFSKAEMETEITEMYTVITEVRHAVKNLKKWAAPKTVETPLALFGTRGKVIYEPRGVVLIMAPWNFPFMLTIGPLISAIAAGNCVMIKPSEVAAHTAAFMAKMIRTLFKPEEVMLIEGGVELSKELLELPFDHIFFTGGSEVGKIVMQAAAKNLSSVTLELGGKSPVIIDETASIGKAAKRLVWGKFLNAGQACVAPDYLLIHKDKERAFVEAFKKQVVKMYGENPEKSIDFARIINDRHFVRLKTALDAACERGAEIVVGGETDEEERYIAPTLIGKVPMDTTLMEDEIFGPIFPYMTFEKREDALKVIQGLPKPLAMYVFSNSNRNVRYFIENTSAGSTVVNDNVLQFIHAELPFGGVNFSGMGKGHGYHGFMEFTNERSVVVQNRFWGSSELIHPPFTGFKRLVSKVLRKFL